MRILIVGSGGREHALAWKLSQSPLVTEILIAPGNGGTAALGENVPVRDSDVPGLIRLAKDRLVDLVVAGPELPLTLGLTDALGEAGIPCFGPDRFNAQLEGSKAFAKTMMREVGVPTADFAVFEDHARARDFVASLKGPMVVKADGLAAGKGVVVCRDKPQALAVLDQMMAARVFGQAGERVVIEEALVGEEASFLCLCDGVTVRPLPSAQDHKAIGEGDTGPNTGGMGAYTPARILPESAWEKTADLVARPIARHLASLGHPFKGVLYAGLMYTAAGPMVLEYNVRFGDPECQPLLARLDSDLALAMLACVEGRLADVTVRWRPETSVCVVLASEGYPGPYQAGREIHGLAEADEMPGVKVFHSGTRIEGSKILTSGGRVLGVTALGRDLAGARQAAYKAVDLINFEGKYCRRDIGVKGL